MRRASVRVAPNGYVAALLPALFFAAFFLYLETDSIALILVGVSAALPLLAAFDRIEVDGLAISRTGLLPSLWAQMRGMPTKLGFDEVEQVETQALRALRKGGSVFYRYRTTVVGRGQRFVLASGGTRYRELVRQFLCRVPECALDNRSLELRDYLSDPLDVLLKADIARIPGADVLGDSLFNPDGSLSKAVRALPVSETGQSGAESARADHLRRLANELRISGYLLQSLEAFRRAITLNPRDGWLLFDTARCLHALGAANRNARMQNTARALLRLSEMRANGDRELLSRIGECHFQFGSFERARNAFQNAADTIEENFRALRGLAELALRQGKLAHTVLHFRAAGRIAETAALRRWSQTEAEYFSMLSSDEEYLRKEVRRVNLLDDLSKAKNKALRIGFIGIPPILVGNYFEDLMVTQIGWAVSLSGVMFWVLINLGLNLFARRVGIPGSK